MDENKKVMLVRHTTFLSIAHNKFSQIESDSRDLSRQAIPEIVLPRKKDYDA